MIGSRAIAPTAVARTDFHLRRVFSHHTRRWHYRKTQDQNRSPFDRIILLCGETDKRAPKKGNQDMKSKLWAGSAEWLGHDDMARVGF